MRDGFFFTRIGDWYGAIIGFRLVKAQVFSSLGQVCAAPRAWNMWVYGAC